MAALQPFAPQYDNGQTVTASGTSGSVNITANALNVCITNTGLNIAYVKIGTGTVTATANNFPIPAGAQRILTKSSIHDVIAYISASGTTLNIITGEGWL